MEGEEKEKRKKGKEAREDLENQGGKNWKDEEETLTLLKGQKACKETTIHSCEPAMKGKGNENLPGLFILINCCFLCRSH